MATISIPKDLYDKLIRLGKDPGDFVSEAAEEKLAAQNGKDKPQPQKAG